MAKNHDHLLDPGLLPSARSVVRQERTASVHPRVRPVRGQNTLTGTVLDSQFRVLNPIGSGGMGTIYLGEQQTFERQVVIKVLHPKYTDDAKKLERFRREAKAVARLNHPNIVKLYHFGTTEQGQLYLAMEYVPGRTIADEVYATKGIPEERAVRIARQLVDALCEAHRLGIVHRDLKPANIMLTSHRNNADFVKVLDFGVAKDLVADDGNLALTRSGAKVGTPPYMSPEQVRGQKLDARSDLYAVGLILYELVVGERAMTGRHHADVYAKQLRKNPTLPSIRRPGLVLSQAALKIIERCLRKDPKDRYQTAPELLNDLKALLSEHHPTVEPARAVVAPTPAATPVAKKIALYTSVAMVVLVVLAAIVGPSSQNSLAGDSNTNAAVDSESSELALHLSAESSEALSTAFLGEYQRATNALAESLTSEGELPTDELPTDELPTDELPTDEPLTADGGEPESAQEMVTLVEGPFGSVLIPGSQHINTVPPATELYTSPLGYAETVALYQQHYAGRDDVFVLDSDFNGERSFTVLPLERRQGIYSAMTIVPPLEDGSSAGLVQISIMR